MPASSLNHIPGVVSLQQKANPLKTSVLIKPKNFKHCCDFGKFLSNFVIHYLDTVWKFIECFFMCLFAYELLLVKDNLHKSIITK